MPPPPESSNNNRHSPSMQDVKSTHNIKSPNLAPTVGATASVRRGHNLHRSLGDDSDRLYGFLRHGTNRLVHGTPAIRAIPRIGDGTEQSNRETHENTHFQDSFPFFNAKTEHDTTCHSAPGRRHLPSGSYQIQGYRCCSSGSFHSQRPRTCR